MASPTEASSFSAGSDHHGRPAKLKLKRKVTTTEPDQEPWQLNLLSGSAPPSPRLALNLSPPSSLEEPALLAPVGAASFPARRAGKAPARDSRCSFCGKHFGTSQALGGHQNAHKQERAVEKRRKGLEELGALASHYVPRYPQPWVPLASLVHKQSYPYPTWSGSGSRFGQALSGFTAPPPQPPLGQLRYGLGGLGSTPLAPSSGTRSLFESGSGLGGRVTFSSLFETGFNNSSLLRANTNSNNNHFGSLNLGPFRRQQIIPPTLRFPVLPAKPTGGESGEAQENHDNAEENGHGVDLDLKL